MLTFCGLDCGQCEYREKCNCKGCRETGGKPFHGTCELAQCCIGRGHQTCADCGEFPCQLLTRYSYEATHGDNGRRIAALRELKPG